MCFRPEIMVTDIAPPRRSMHAAAMINDMILFDGQRGCSGMTPVRRAQIENLYLDALVLADEAQQIFADSREAVVAAHDHELSVAAVTEAMMTATRLTHILAWLLHQRAVMAGEPGAYLDDVTMTLSDVAPADWSVCDQLDESIRRVTLASERLYQRIMLLDDLWSDPIMPSPVLAMLAELEARL